MMVTTICNMCTVQKTHLYLQKVQHHLLSQLLRNQLLKKVSFRSDKISRPAVASKIK